MELTIFQKFIETNLICILDIPNVNLKCSKFVNSILNAEKLEHLSIVILDTDQNILQSSTYAYFTKTRMSNWVRVEGARKRWTQYMHGNFFARWTFRYRFLALCFGSLFLISPLEGYRSSLKGPVRRGSIIRKCEENTT